MSRVTQRALLDEKLLPLRESIPPPPENGWVNAIRKALGMTAKQLGARVGVTQSAVAELENSERERTITLRSLDRVAEALDCEVRYVLVPKESLTKTVSSRAAYVYEKEKRAVSRTMALENQEPKSDTRHALEVAMFLLENEKKIWDNE